MSVDLDDPWAEDLASELAVRTQKNTRTGSGSGRGRARAVSAPHPQSSSDTDFDNWSPISPFSPTDSDNASAHKKGRSSGTPTRSKSPTKTPKPSTVRGHAVKPAPGLSRSTSAATRPPRSTSHPLALDTALGRLSVASDTDLSDVSRPALKRVTSITERQVADSQAHSRAESRCGSEVGSSSRGSVDLAHAEVEVVVHQVKPNESITGIALRYGIELAVLRRANKLWPSDPVHLRTHLYVPLDACKPTTKGVQIVRGPGGGQVTIVSRKKQPPNGTVTSGGNGTGNGLGVEAEFGHTRSASTQSWESGQSVNETIKEGQRAGSPDTVIGVAASNANHADEAQILDIVRLPASQLRFFPRGKRETPRARASLDSDIGRSADSVRSLSTIERQRRKEARATERESIGRKAGMFAPLGALTAAAEAAVLPPKKRIVRLRPPQASTPTDDSFTGQLKSLFSVPPPPVYPVPTRPKVPRALPAESNESQSDSGTGSQAQIVEVEVEMDMGPWGRTLGAPHTLRKTDKKRD